MSVRHDLFNRLLVFVDNRMPTGFACKSAFDKAIADIFAIAGIHKPSTSATLTFSVVNYTLATFVLNTDPLPGSHCGS